MTLRKSKHRKDEKDNLCLTCDCCTCSEHCAHPGCELRCLGGHANYPDSHWCAEAHWWKTADTTPISATVSGRRRRR